MKYLLIIICAFTYTSAKAQTDTLTAADTAVYIAVQQPVEFPGGPEKLKTTVAKMVRYPADAREKRIQGKVIVSFIVEKDGKLTHLKILQHLSDDTDAEALRVVGNLPKWKPGVQSGKVIRQEWTVAVPFYLGEFKMF
ncbi:energy transducer TonB [Mucilaginibacter conchicola]|uniref:Energy transducer TonB n=1 Tax=Mucilaginibacter conchicola TaxID=2303333 RepID=A0A372NWE9_9SPHI|nr:energy transducer TonB [Mucilaginibacter conchicola]RFZ94372.1 energy transducer TonB [Mucilaginibacter conchicola]